MSKSAYPYLASLIFNTPLMIQRAKLHAIIRGLGVKIGADYFDDEADDDEDMVATAKPSASDMPAGIRCIQVYGSLVKRAAGLNAMSGLTTYESLTAKLMDAATDPACKAILMDFDSYGGGVDGCFDLADLIYQVRQSVPVYGLASACEKLWVTQDGGVGSIGVIAEHCDESELNAKIGVKYTTFSFGAHKNDFSPNGPVGDAAAANLQASIDRFGNMFVALVARNRGMSADAVLGTQAEVYDAQPALALGLVDYVGTRADVAAALQSRISTRRLIPMPGQQGMDARKLDASIGKLTASIDRISTATATAGVDVQQDGTRTTAIVTAEGDRILIEDFVPTAPASVGAISKEGISMPEPTPADASNRGTPPADLTAIRQEGHKEATAMFAARQNQIIALCKIAGAPELALEYLGSTITVEEVQAALLERRAKQMTASDANGKDADLETQFLPNGEPTKGAANNPNRLMDAVKRRIAGRAKGGN
jgi:ClpP class serine protease